MKPRLRLVAIGVLSGLWFTMPLYATGRPTAPDGIAQLPRGSPQLEVQARTAEARQMQQEVAAFLQHYIQTLESRDERAIRALFVDDERFAWFTDGARKYSTPDQVLAGMRTYGEIRFQTSLSDVRVLRLAAGLASAESSFATKLTIPGSPSAEFAGVITWLVEKDPASGKWRVLMGHTSTPGGPPAPSSPSTQR